MDKKCIFCKKKTDNQIKCPDGLETICERCARTMQRIGIVDFTKQGCFGKFVQAERKDLP